jgi:thymidylate synthase (FAD)
MPLMFYTPEREQVSHQAKSNKQGREGVLPEKDYETFVNGLKDIRGETSKFYTRNINEDISRELSRIDLPLSTYTFCYWKMDLRNMLHMIGLRSDPHAQWEIRAFSDVLAGIVQRVAPISFDAFLDYQMDSVSFSQAELPALNMMGAANAMCTEEDTKVVVNRCLLENGIKGREVDEFWAKVLPREKRDFSLDLSKAKPPEFFSKMMEEYAVETQN